MKLSTVANWIMESLKNVKKSFYVNNRIIVYALGTSPKTYYNLPLGDHTISIKAQAVKLGLPLDPAIADRNFTIVTPGIIVHTSNIMYRNY